MASARTARAYGYLLDANGKVRLHRFYNREVAAHPEARKVQVWDKTCLCTHAQLRYLDLRPADLSSEDTTNRLADGSYQVPSAEHLQGLPVQHRSKVALPEA